MATHPPPNYINPETRQPEILKIEISLQAAALLVLFLRLYARHFLGQQYGTDDWIIIFANLIATLATTCSCLSIIGGTGLHVWDLKPGTDIMLANQLSYVNQFFYYPTMQLVRISILTLYLSLSPNIKFRRFTQAMILLCIAYLIAVQIPEIFQCNPMPKTVYGAAIQGTCFNQTLFHTINNAIGIFLDLIILIMPIGIIKGLQITRRQRILLAIAFCPGLASLAASCKRLSIFIAVLKVSHGANRNRNSPDVTWGRVDAYNWSCVEYCMALICASLPHTKPLVTKFIPEKIAQTRSRSRSGAKNIYVDESGKSASSAAKRASRYGRLDGSNEEHQMVSVVSSNGRTHQWTNGSGDEWPISPLTPTVKDKEIHVRTEFEMLENRP